MNIYDFDNTIMDGDASIKFIKYSLVRHPLKVFTSFIKAFIRFLKRDNLGAVKGEVFSFIKNIPDRDKYIDNFVLKNMCHIKKFYLDKKKDNDLIISASFDFIIEPFCTYLGVSSISTLYDLDKGCIIGNNCKGEEKVKRFNERYKGKLVLEAYSDSLSDIPMLKLAKKAYLVKKDKITLYNVGDK